MNYYDILLARKLAKGELPPNAYLLKEASGSLVSFSDGADLPMPSFICKIEAVQSGSGDPSPENVRPISGHTGVDAWVRGKNLIDIPNRIISTSLGISTISSENCTATKNGEVITATITGAWSKLSIQVKNGIQLKNGETYTFSATFDNPNGNRIGLTYRYAKGEWIKIASIVTDTHIRLSGSFTYDSSIDDYVICSCIINNTNASTNNTVTVKDIMLEKGSTVSDWDTYNPNSQTIQVSWRSEAGEVYGGEVDLVSGVLTATRGNYTNTWNNGASPVDLGDYTRKSFRYVDLSKNETALNTYMNCAKLEGSWAGNNLHFLINTSNHNEVYVYLPNNTTDDFQIQLSYELATPQTYQLTPTQIKSLLGNNNAWCNTGDVTLEYFGKGAE